MPKNGLVQLYESYALAHIARHGLADTESEISRSHVEFELLSEIDKQSFPIEYKLTWIKTILATHYFDDFWLSATRCLNLPEDCTIRYRPDFSLLSYEIPADVDDSASAGSQPELTEEHADNDAVSLSPEEPQPEWATARAAWLGRSPTPPGGESVPYTGPTKPSPTIRYITVSEDDTSSEASDDAIVTKMPNTDPQVLYDLESSTGEDGGHGDPEPSLNKTEQSSAIRQETTTPSPNSNQAPKAKAPPKQKKTVAKATPKRTVRKAPKAASPIKTEPGDVKEIDGFEAVTRAVSSKKRDSTAIEEDNEPRAPTSTNSKKRRISTTEEAEGGAGGGYSVATNPPAKKARSADTVDDEVDEDEVVVRSASGKKRRSSAIAETTNETQAPKSAGPKKRGFAWVGELQEGDYDGVEDSPGKKARKIITGTAQRKKPARKAPVKKI